tara:strand:- start:225 stop:878 length:654 start_codon:yes stop_codon:yes gene_type:complete
MKNAVILCGEPRTYKQTYKNFLRIFKGWDVYIVTYDDCYNCKMKDTYNPKNACLISRNDIEKEKNRLSNSWLYNKWLNNKKGIMLRGYISQTYMWKKGFEMIDKSNINYNLICKIRFDILISNINFNNLDENLIYADNFVHPPLKNQQYYLCDWWYISGQYNMKLLCNFFDEISQFKSDLLINDTGKYVNLENVIGFYIKEHLKININNTNSFQLIR